MTALESPVLPLLVLFCRIGGCLMVAPGFSSDRTPVQARLYLALAITLALAPMLLEPLPRERLTGSAPLALLAAIGSEVAIGVTLGFLARLYFLALETLSTAIALAFGLGNIFGAAVTEPEPTPALSSFVVTCAIALMFCADLHLEIIRALVLSYETAPALAAPEAGVLVEEVTHVLTDAHLLALRIASPFLLFALIVNLALGLLARLTPQAQIYFIATPAVVLLCVGGFFFLGWDFFSAFLSHFGAWLERG